MALVIAASSFTLAQKEKKYEKLYYKNVKQDLEKYSVEVDNAVSTPGETKFKLKITKKKRITLFLNRKNVPLLLMVKPRLQRKNG